MKWSEPERTSALIKQLQIDIERGDHKRALRCLRRLPLRMEWESLRDCIQGALYVSVAVLEELFKRVSGKEQVGFLELPLRLAKPYKKGRYREIYYIAEVQGTLPVLAAALNRPNHLRCLLEWGCDPNSASLDATAELMGDNARSIFFSRLSERTGGLSAHGNSSILLRRDGEETIDFTGVTPLAAAIAFGSVACVELLLNWEGVWREECPVVSKAVMLPRCSDDLSGWMASRLVEQSRKEAPSLWPGISICSVDVLKQELETVAFSPEQLEKAAIELINQARGWEAEEKLNRLEGYAPQVFQCPDVQKALLRRACWDKRQWERILRVYHHRVVDLSPLMCSLGAGDENGELLQRLRVLADTAHCVIHRDSLLYFPGCRRLKWLLHAVERLPVRFHGGLTTLTCAILRTENPKLIQKAIQKGWILPEESTQLLLAYQREQDLSEGIRPVLLCARCTNEKDTVLEPGELDDWSFWRYFQTSDSDEKNWMECICSASDPVWETKYQLLKENLLKQEKLFFVARDRMWGIYTVLSRVCILGEAEIMAWWVGGNRGALYEVHSVYLPDEAIRLNATPLCLAAFAGQMDMVQTLLDCGAPVQEERCGTPSSVQKEREWRLPMTPLLAALLEGHTELAELLMRHGAVLPKGQGVVAQLWKRLGKGELPTLLSE